MQVKSKSVKNLSQLKNALSSGSYFIITYHRKLETIGQIRRVNIANTQGIYSTIPDDPSSSVSTANCGKGVWLAFGKASNWHFSDEGASLYFGKDHTPEQLIMTIKLLEGNDDE